MAENKNKPQRNAKGQIMKGTKLPGAGRPKGKDPTKLTRMTAQKRAILLVEKLLDRAYAKVEAEIQPRGISPLFDMEGNPVLDEDGKQEMVPVGGDARVAMWAIERLCMPNADNTLPHEMDVNLSTMEGVIDAGQTTVEWVASRQLSLDQGEKMLRLLLTYAQMRAFDHIDELKQLISTFEAQSGGALSGGMSDQLIPQWGRLTNKTKVANKTPAE